MSIVALTPSLVRAPASSLAFDDNAVLTVVALIRKIGIGLVAAAAVVLIWRALLLAVGLFVLVVLAFIGWQQFTIWSAAQRFRKARHPLGKDLLLVYSNSPHWQSYIEKNWFPRWHLRAEVLNWSERSTWKKSLPEVALFHAMAGQREYNPLAIVVPAHGRPVAVRFWKAFRDYKHGKGQKLTQQENELERLLALHPPPGT